MFGLGRSGVKPQAGALPRDQQKALLEKVQKSMPSARFHDWKRLRNDAIDLMNTHVNLQPSLGTVSGKPGVHFVKLEGNVKMAYQGAGYWVPLAILLPEDYPAAVAVLEVRPTGDLMIPPAHARVDESGTVYLPYLNQWDKKSTALGAVNELKECFATKPFIYKRAPVVARPAARPPPPANRTPPPPPPPPPPYTESPPPYSAVDPPSAPGATVVASVSKLVESFTCPISMELMSDPVFAADGHTYERSFIEEWLQTHTTSPLTNQPLQHKHLVPNHNLRSQILEYQENPH